MNSDEDTIAAISTPQGSGGIAILRLSGSRAIEIADKIFFGKRRLIAAESHRAYFGRIVEKENRAAYTNGAGNTNGFLDEALFTVFRAPNSYTREDVVEISCHGGQLLTAKVLQLLLDGGARLANPGEFSKRAFLNGRLDLSQAEAVADMIQAKTDKTLKAAVNQYRGVFSNRIKELRQDLIEICSLLELELDFAEEDVEFADRREVQKKITTTIENIARLIDSYRTGKILREGAKLVIVGRPNVGKSSLLNALLKEDRAIVTDLPGTTRDVLEEQLDIRGVLFRVIDTAGMRRTRNRVEKEGVSRTLSKIKEADVILLIFDGSEPIGREDIRISQEVQAIREADSPGQAEIILLLNKSDLPRQLTAKAVADQVGAYPILEISARENSGLDQLEELLVHTVLGREQLHADQAMVTNLRQKTALEKARSLLQNALASVDDGLSSEFVALDLRAALDQLGEVIGEVTTEDILGNIFSKFCIGK